MTEEWWDNTVKNVILSVQKDEFQSSDRLSEAIITGISDRLEAHPTNHNLSDVEREHLKDLITNQLGNRIRTEEIELIAPQLTESATINVLEKLESLNKVSGKTKHFDLSSEPWWDD